MFLYLKSGDLNSLRRVTVQGVGVLMVEESRQKRLGMFQKGSQKTPKYPLPWRVEIIWTMLRKMARVGFGCQSQYMGENSFPRSQGQKDKMENQDSDS